MIESSGGARRFPVPLRAWSGLPPPNRSERLVQARRQQMAFVKDRIWSEFELYGSRSHCSELLVIGSYVPQYQIELPIYRLEVDGFRFTLRGNFFDWMVSVAAPFDVTADFGDLFVDDRQVPDAEEWGGMPKEFLYAPYRENRQCFTAYGIDDDYALWTFFFILRTWWARMRYRAERGASAT